MTDLTLSVRLTAEGDGLVGAVRVSKDELAKLSKTATDASKAQEGAARGMAGVGRSAEAAGGQVRGMDGQVAGLTKRVTGLVAAWLSFESVKNVLAGVARETMNAERVSARLDAVLRATGNAAGFTRAELDALAESMASRTLFDDESIRQGIAVMATFKSVTGDTFREAIEQSANLAALLGGDFQSAVLQVGKTLEEPTLGLTMLRRAGIAFSESQREVIERLDQTGRKAEAQGLILAGLSERMGGVAGAQNTGLVGQITSLTKAWNDLLEAIGRRPAFQRTADAILGRLFGGTLENLRALIQPGGPGGAGGGTPPKPVVELDQKQRDVLRGLAEQTALIGRSSVAAEQFKALKAAGFEPTLGAGGGVTVKDIEKLPEAFRDAVEKILGDVALIGRAGFGEQTRGIERSIAAADEFRVGRALGPDARAGIAGRRQAIDFAAQNKITDEEQIQLLQRLFTALEKSNRELQLTEELYDRLRGPEERYAERLRTIQREHANGGISAEEMGRATREAYLEMLEASREWEDGVKRGVVKTLDEAGDAAKGFEDLTVGSFRRGEDAMVNWARTGKLAAGDLFSFIEEQLIRIAYRAFILKPFLEPLEAALGGFAKSASGGGAGFEVGDIGTPVAELHSGGVVGRDGVPRTVPAALFENAPRFHMGGPIGPGERPIIAREGEIVGWPEQLSRAFGSNVTVEIVDQRGQGAPPIETTSERGPDGREVIRAIVRGETKQGFDDGAYDSVLRLNYGLGRVPQTRRS